MRGLFKIEIALGNDVMQTPDDVSHALAVTAEKINAGELFSGAIHDANGNRVGTWWTEDEE